MSNRSILRHQRAKSKHNAKHIPAGLQPVCVVPGAVVPTGPVPLCRSHLEPMVYTACQCHPWQADWQCSRAPLTGHMKRIK